MATEAHQAVMQNIARTKAHIRKGLAVDALEDLCAALKHFVPERMTNQERYEGSVLVSECVTEISRNPGVHELLRAVAKGDKAPRIAYQAGEEKQLFATLTILHKALLRKEEARAEYEKQQRIARREALWNKAQKHLDEGDAPLGKAVLRRLVDEFGEDDSVILEAGDLLMRNKLFFEAAEFYARAIELFPKDSRAYTSAVNAYIELREFEKAEEVYQKAIKQFGQHPNTLLNLARLYKMWGKRDPAFLTAQKALHISPGNAEAQALMDWADRK